MPRTHPCDPAPFECDGPRLVSVYGYPREPEETGDEPPVDPPYRVSSHPVSVPAGPSSSAAPPPQPLLPSDPPGAPYASLADVIPIQRPVPGSEHAPVLVPEVAPPNGPRPGRHATDDPEPMFDWLRQADPSAPEFPTADPSPLGFPPADPSPLGFPPVDAPRGFAPVESAPSGFPPVDPLGFPPVEPGFPPVDAAPPGFPPVDPSLPGMSPVDAASHGFRPVEASPPPLPPQFRPVDPPGAAPFGERPAFGPSPSMGQPAVPMAAPPASAAPPVTSAPPASPVSAAPPVSATARVPGTERPAFGPSPSMGQPAVPVAAPATPQPVAAAEPATVPAQPPRVTRPAPLRPTITDEPEIPPWDRRPLLIVIAAAAVLVLIGIISGVIAAAIASAPAATWREPGSQSTADPGAPPSDAAAPPAAAAETITLSGVGDVIMGSANLGTPPNNGAGFFDGVREALAADLVMGNLDMTLSDPTGYAKCSPGATDCFQLSLPPSYAGVLRDGGFQLMTLANNHTYDMGEQGYANTAAALESAGIQHTGGVDQITYVTVKGAAVAVLGFSVYSYTANLNDLGRAADLVREAATQADVVVVQMQGGAEGSDQTSVPPAGTHESFAGEDRGDLRGFAHAVIDAGADVVIGHGPHVMRGMEFYQGRLIAYSLGNFCGYAVLSSAGWSGVGGILSVTLQRDGAWAGGRLVATELVGPGSPAVDAELRALAFVDDLSVQDFGGAAARIDHGTGTITAP
jgi:Bacterial capsule synthesis protein PGA_cap